LDENLVDEISDKVTIIKQPIFEPYGFASFLSKNKTKKISSGIIPNKRKQSFLERMLLWVRGNLFIPDARIFWVKPSIKFLQKYIKEHKIETIITTGPPHSVHLIGLGLKKQNNIKWIADFRDPWTTIGYHKSLKLSKNSAQKHKDLEKEVMMACDQLIVTSPTTKIEFENITSKPIEVITNGYDIENISKKLMDSKFTLAHIGSFLSERNPRILWKSLSELVNENKDFANDFQLKLIGSVSKEVLETIKEFRLEKYLNHLGYVSHNEALQEQRSSQVLLLVEIDSEVTNCIIPGKLFEYMVSERPVLAIGPDKADFKNIIKETNTGTFFTYDEKEALKSQIETYYKQFKQNTLQVNAIGLQKYSRKKLTEHLATLLTKH
jgi:glycosyltransferase involved in cell wall biosynthesis